jgi:hypothetical protein
MGTDRADGASTAPMAFPDPIRSDFCGQITTRPVACQRSVSNSSVGSEPSGMPDGRWGPTRDRDPQFRTIDSAVSTI